MKGFLFCAAVAALSGSLLGADISYFPNISVATNAFIGNTWIDGVAAISIGHNGANINFGPLADATILRTGAGELQVKTNLTITGEITASSGVITNVDATTLTLVSGISPSKLLGTDASTNVVTGTAAMLTNTAGIFTGETTKFWRADNTMATPTDGTANWTASGTTNSTLPGNAYLNALTATNGVTSGAIIESAGWKSKNYKTSLDNSVIGLYIPATGQFAFGSNDTGGAPDIFLQRDAANTLALRNGTAAQTNRVYTSYANGGTDYERLGINTTAGSITLAAESAGTGSANISTTLSAKGTGTATVNGGAATGTDTAAGPVSIQGGISTGTGRGGALVHKTSLSSTTGSTANTLSTRRYESAKFVDLTESSATPLLSITCGTNNYVGATFTVTVFATDGTDHQSLTSRVTLDAVDKAGTVTTTVSQVDNTAAVSSGTLACTYTVAGSTTNVVLSANAVSSLTQTILRAKWIASDINSNDPATITAN